MSQAKNVFRNKLKTGPSEVMSSKVMEEKEKNLYN